MNEVTILALQMNHSQTWQTQSGPLDYAITIKEAELAIDRLKFKKATGFDMIPNEIMKCGKKELLAPLTLLFNIKLSSAFYPQDWCVGLIIPIHTKGDKSNVENYRGTTLLSPAKKALHFHTEPTFKRIPTGPKHFKNRAIWIQKCLLNNWQHLHAKMSRRQTRQE